MSARLALALVLLASGIGTARAGAAGDCSNEVTQTDLNICFDKLFRRADAELNRVYAQVRGKISPAGQSMLRDVERAWLDYRDKECEFETAGSAGGSIRPMLVSQCLAALTNRRIRELETQRDCKDDLCGGQ